MHGFVSKKAAGCCLAAFFFNGRNRSSLMWYNESGTFNVRGLLR
ncbi:hypothetical protein I656_00337 [Geobacillus sp. WSUCF1]|nr:hypothetical protein I656_00337 [Geobacillus sp. WSUCF1]